MTPSLGPGPVRGRRGFPAAIALGVVLSLPAGGEEITYRYIDGMRERRLDQLLEVFCQKELSRPGLTEAQGARLATEYAALLAELATQETRPEERERSWQKAEMLLEGALERTANPVHRQAIGFQAALLELMRGEWLRESAEVAVDSGPLWAAARTHFEAATKRLDLLAREAATDGERTKPPVGTAARVKPSRASAELRAEIEYQRGLAELSLARTLGPDDNRRAPLLAAAIERLRAASEGNPDPARSFQATRELVLAYRLLGDFPNGGKLLDELKRWPLSPAQADTLLAERAEWLLDQGKAAETIELLDAVARGRARPPARWLYLLARASLVRAAELGPAAAEAKELQETAFRQMARLEAAGDARWLRRAELLLRDHAAALSAHDFDNLRRAARMLARSGEYTEAADLFKDAAARAERKRDSTQVALLLEEAGQVLESAGQYGEAAGLFADLARRRRDAPEAPAALLRAARDARRAHLAAPDAASLARFSAILEEHERLYPDDPTAVDVQFLLGTLAVARRDYSSAITRWNSIPPGHPLAAEARRWTSRVYEAWLRPLEDDPPATAGNEKALAAALDFHEEFAHATLDPEAWPAAARAAILLRHARLLLDQRVDEPARAREVLDELLKLPDLPPEQAFEARGLALFASASLGEARLDRSTAWSAWEPSALLATADRLESLAQFAAPTRQRYLGQLQQRLLGPLWDDPQRVAGDAVIELELATARSDLNLGEADRLDSALRRLKNLTRERPNDPRVLFALGSGYLRGRRYELAAETARRLIEVTQPTSQHWFRGKLLLASALRRSGQLDQAAKVIEVLEVLHPDLGGTRMRQRFLEEKNAAKSKR